MTDTSARRLRIAQVVTRMDVGGVPDHVLTLARGLARDHDVTVLCGAIDPRHAASLKSAGVTVETMGFRRLPHPADLGTFARLVGTFRRRRFDVVHTHMSKAALVGGAAAVLARVPAVVNTAHNLGFLALSHPVGRALFWAYDRALFAATMDRIVTVSERVRAGVVAGRVVPAARVVAIHNGIETARFDGPFDETAAMRAGFGAGPDDLVIVTVARLVWFKGLDALVAALPALLARHPATRVVVVGAGPLRAALEAQAAALGVGAWMVFTGERSDVPAILAAADVFVLPSVSEGLPISILEAMAAGRPVVATSVGGIPELIVEGETGLLVPPRDTAALGAALLRLAADAGLRQRMGAAARARIAEHFSPTKMVAETAALYRSVLARKDAAR